jgi:hypothetical protein
MTNLNVYTQFELLPDELKREVADFIQFLVEKENKKKGTMKERKLGLAKGLIDMTLDFVDHLEDFNEYMD